MEWSNGDYFFLALFFIVAAVASTAIYRISLRWSVRKLRHPKHLRLVMALLGVGAFAIWSLDYRGMEDVEGSWIWPYPLGAFSIILFILFIYSVVRYLKPVPLQSD